MTTGPSAWLWKRGIGCLGDYEHHIRALIAQRAKTKAPSAEVGGGWESATQTEKAKTSKDSKGHRYWKQRNEGKYSDTKTGKEEE